MNRTYEKHFERVGFFFIFGVFIRSLFSQIWFIGQKPSLWLFKFWNTALWFLVFCTFADLSLKKISCPQFFSS